MLQRLSLLIGLALALAACTPDATRNQDPGAQGATPPSFEYFMVTNNQVSLLAAPEVGASLVEQVALGTLTKGLQGVSEKKYELELGGRLWLEPFYKILTPSGKEGWAYGGGLLRVFSGTDSAYLDGARLEEFARALARIGDRTPAQALEAGALAGRMFQNANPATADAASLLLENYLTMMMMGESLYQYVEDASWVTDSVIRAIGSGQFDMHTHPQSKKLALAGFTLATAEGLVYPEIDHLHIRRLFEGRLSAPMDRFYALQAVETDALRDMDRMPEASLMSIADRAATWEQFNRDYPYFVRREASLFNEQYLIHSLTHGAPGTFLFDQETGVLTGGFREVWAYIQERYPGTRLARYAQRMMQSCEASGWKASSATDAEMAAITRELMPD